VIFSALNSQGGDDKPHGRIFESSALRPGTGAPSLFANGER
jgi:hypothetical protein